jgi:hypothetical protein
MAFALHSYKCIFNFHHLTANSQMSKLTWVQAFFLCVSMTASILSPEIFSKQDPQLNYYGEVR